MEDGKVQTKYWSGYPLVQKPTADIYLKLEEVKCKVMFYPNNVGPRLFPLQFSQLYPHCSMFSWTGGCCSDSWRGRRRRNVFWGSQINKWKEENCSSTTTDWQCKMAGLKPMFEGETDVYDIGKFALEQHSRSGKWQVVSWELLGVDSVRSYTGSIRWLKRSLKAILSFG